MKRFLALVLLALALASPAAAQSLGGEASGPYTLVALRDVDATSFEYCSSTGLSNMARSEGRPGTALVLTVGDVATLQAATAGTNPFAEVSIGDIVTLFTDKTLAQRGLGQERVITAKASADSVTLNQSIDIPNGLGFFWRKVSCGTAATDGWVNVRGLRNVNFQFVLSQLNVTAGGFDYKFECTLDGVGGTPVQVVASVNVTATTSVSLTFTVPYDRCRVGFKLTTDDGTDTGAAAEQVTVIFETWR